jgi:hypothetical protein
MCVLLFVLISAQGFFFTGIGTTGRFFLAILFARTFFFAGFATGSACFVLFFTVVHG